MLVRSAYRFQINSLPYVYDDKPPRWGTGQQFNHDLHLIHTLRGKGVLHIGDAAYESTPRCVLAVPIRTVCHWDKCGDAPWEMINLHYTVTLAGGSALEQRYTLPMSFRPTRLQAIHRTLRQCHEQWRGDDMARLRAAGQLQAVAQRYWLEHAEPVKHPPPHDAAVAAVCDRIEQYADAAFDAEDLAASVSLSVSQMNRRFRAARGMSPHAYWQQQRADLCRRVLCESGDTLETLAPRLGFSDVYYFCRWFRNQTGQTPGQFRKMNQPTLY